MRKTTRKRVAGREAAPPPAVVVDFAAWKASRAPRCEYDGPGLFVFEVGDITISSPYLRLLGPLPDYTSSSGAPASAAGSGLNTRGS